MKRLNKIIIFLLLLLFITAGMACRSKKGCGGMKYYYRDVKKGLAH